MMNHARGERSRKFIEECRRQSSPDGDYYAAGEGKQGCLGQLDSEEPRQVNAR